MNLLIFIFKYLGPVLLLFALWFDYRLKHVTPDGRTTLHKKTSKTKFAILFLAGLLGLFALAGDDWGKSKNEQTAKNEAVELRGQITNLNSEIITQKVLTVNINSNQQVLLEQDRSFRFELATNPSINIDLRQRIVDSNKKFEVVDEQVADLNAWEARLDAMLKNRHAQSIIDREKSLAENLAKEQSELQARAEYYDFAVKTLVGILQQVAKREGDKVASNYQGLPTLLNNDTGWSNLAEVEFQANTNVCFQILLEKTRVGIPFYFGRPWPFKISHWRPTRA